MRGKKTRCKTNQTKKLIERDEMKQKRGMEMKQLRQQKTKLEKLNKEELKHGEATSQE